MSHKESLYRMASELTAINDGNTLVGYAAKFDSPTLINSWEGRFIEQIAPGAFKRTIKNQGDKIKVLFNHGQDPAVGERPLGKPSVIREDEHGLYVEVPLDDTSYNRDLKASLASGAIDGMSFRFSVVQEEWDETGEVDVRTIQEAKLFEFGPVVFPAYSDTNAGLRSDPRFDDLRRQLNNGETVTLDDYSPPTEDSPESDPAEDTSDTQQEDGPPEAPVNRTAHEEWRRKVALINERANNAERRSLRR